MSSDTIKTGKISRLGEIGKAATTIGFRNIKHNTLKPFLSKSKSQQEKFLLDDKNAKTIFQALSRMRGTALKIAQLLSLETDLLPKAYVRELSKSCYQVPPLNRAVIRKVIKSQLGKFPEKLFKNFEGKAFAAASLGQVHRAESLDGKQLAVKVQYPGIDRSIHSDIQIFKNLLKVRANSRILSQTIKEVEERLEEEVDYQLEAKNTRWFQENLQMEGIVVSNVVEELSSSKVISFERLNGDHLSNWLEKKPSQELRNQTGQLLFDAYNYSFFNLNTFQADSNPGNYLFSENGTISMLDFGCIKKVPTEFPELIAKLVRATINKDQHGIIEIYISLGMLTGKNSAQTERIYVEVLEPMCNWIKAPYEDDVFDFKANYGYASSILPHMYQLTSHEELEVINRDFVFFMRALRGLYRIFEEMGVAINLADRLPEVK